MGLAELFLLAVGLAMDAFAVSICKGLAIEKDRGRAAGSGRVRSSSAGLCWS